MSGNKGYFAYKGYAVMQHDNAVQVFRDFIETVRPKRILEIGTAHGGFTLAIRDLLNEAGLSASAVRSFDVTSRPGYDAIRSQNIEVVVENIFHHSYTELTKPELIVPFIQESGTTLVLCDGAYKVGEFNLIAPHIKTGDYIMAHDYIDTEENFRQNYFEQIWDWQEVRECDLRDTCEQYCLVDCNGKAFNRVVWTCKKKQTWSALDRGALRQ
jgi:cephalosporin hydroxylase